VQCKMLSRIYEQSVQLGVGVEIQDVFGPSVYKDSKIEFMVFLRYVNYGPRLAKESGRVTCGSRH
jgi:hypothetical protein